MYLNITKNDWACDIEADSLTPTVIWCLCAVNILTKEEVILRGHEEIKAWVDARTAEKAKLIFHNAIGYDAPSLNRILGCTITIARLVDTLVMSMLYSPSLDGGHSLGAWGVRLKYPKGEFNDFSHLSPEMIEYCLKDAHLCRLIYIELVKRMLRAKFSETGLELEHRSWQLIQTQKKNGFAFNIVEANILYGKLRTLENEIRDELYTYWPPVLQVVATYKRPYKQDGGQSAQLVRHIEQYERVEIFEDRGEYEVYDYVCFNIGSPPQRIEKLVELGWRHAPDEVTKTGNPKPTDKGRLVPSLVKFVEDSGRPEPKLIARWMEINARANMINTWMEAYNEQSGCIHGNLWLANTLRFKHSGPNTANIPAVRIGKEGSPLLGLEGAFTYEARDLWVTRSRSSRRLVGVDAKGIQLRVLAHYLNNPKFSEAVLEGDPHSYNQEIGGFSTRAIAKTFIYAFLLGCGDAKAGSIIGGSTRDGREVKTRFIGNFPGLRELLDRLEREIERTGRIRLCDGTPIIVSHMHTRLGYLLQGDESRIMKKASILTDREVRRRGLDVLKVCDVHDEHQFDVLKAHVDPFLELLPPSFSEAGKFFNYRVPIDCSTAVGTSWSRTH